MAREARRVPAGWQHPKDKNSRFIPLFQGEDGLSCEDGYMPTWSSEEATHLMMYETTTEGTPISPAFATAEDLARWLANNKVAVYASATATFNEWLQVIKDGFDFFLAITREDKLGVAMARG
jgi:hypothetical protein